VLTNATLLRGKRLKRLCAISNDHLTVQVSLDGARPEHHDPYRGRGTWVKAVDGLRRSLACGLHVSVSTTRTPANEHHLDELRHFLMDSGVNDGDHFVRPLAKRGFATEGMEFGKHNLVPELTVSRYGIYWHPLLAPSNPDTRVCDRILPLRDAMDQIRSEMAQSGSDLQRFRFT
jgi:MoaA/NifB/PqqE/SkfB family radical SAM enzyme